MRIARITFDHACQRAPRALVAVRRETGVNPRRPHNTSMQRTTLRAASIFTSDSATSIVLESRALLDVQEWSGDSRECR